MRSGPFFVLVFSTLCSSRVAEAQLKTIELPARAGRGDATGVATLVNVPFDSAPSIVRAAIAKRKLVFGAESPGKTSASTKGISTCELRWERVPCRVSIWVEYNADTAGTRFVVYAYAVTMTRTERTPNGEYVYVTPSTTNWSIVKNLAAAITSEKQ